MTASTDRDKTGPRAGTGGHDDPFGRFTGTVDIPDFVVELIQGTFQAIVDLTILQMDAYSGLVKNVAAAVGEFVDDASGSVPCAWPTCGRTASPSAAADETRTSAEPAATP